MIVDSFPILYFNMAGEMIYIIDQRLQAQNIELSKSSRVMNDIILSVFNSKLISEVFKPHSAITFFVLKTIFEKLVHSSIMRLNEQSMNKLFDLMIMVIKYQMFACSKPTDIITITDNHFLSIIEMINQTNEDGSRDNSSKQNVHNSNEQNNTSEIVKVVRNQFLFHYKTYDSIQFQYIRYNLMNFLKDIRTRVSIFLREGKQTNDGLFVIPFDRVNVECECQIPGIIRYFQGQGNEIIRTEHFDVGGEYVIDESRTTLGKSIYGKSKMNTAQEDDGSTNQKEIDLLAKLICKTTKEEVLKLTFDFLNAEVSEEAISNADTNNAKNSVQVIDSGNNEQLIQIIQDLDDFSIVTNTQQDTNNNDDLDLLELMDS